MINDAINPVFNPPPGAEVTIRADSEMAVNCNASIAAVRGSLFDVIDDGTPTGRRVYRPQVASEISYDCDVYTPYGLVRITDVRPAGDRPPSPLRIRPASVGSNWPAAIVGQQVFVHIREYADFGPCSGSVPPPPPTVTGPATLPPIELDPRFSPGGVYQPPMQRSPLAPLPPIQRFPGDLQP